MDFTIKEEEEINDAREILVQMVIKRIQEYEVAKQKIKSNRFLYVEQHGKLNETTVKEHFNKLNFSILKKRLAQNDSRAEIKALYEKLPRWFCLNCHDFDVDEMNELRQKQVDVDYVTKCKCNDYWSFLEDDKENMMMFSMEDY